MKKGIWDFWAKYYDRLWVQHLSLRPTRVEIIRQISSLKECRMLDIGCGTGQLLGDIQTKLPGSNIEYVGVDKSLEMINIARRKFPHGNFTVSDVYDFLNTRELFNIIVCAHAFPYFSNKMDVLRGFKMMLHQGGVLLLAQASSNNIYDRMILFFVRLTTSRAQYLGTHEMEKLSAPVFKNPPELIPVGRLYKPSIYLFKWVKE